MAGYSVTFSVVDQASKQIDAINRRIAQTRAPLDRMSRQMSRFIDVSGLRKVATGFEWIGKAAGSVLRTLTSIIPVMGTIVGAASIAGMVKLVSGYAAWSRELVQAADNIGTTTQKLQQFEDATRLAGGNAADMRDSLKGLHDRLADFNIGGASAAVTGQWANKLGINLKGANGQIRTADELLPELIRKIGEIKDPADRAAAAQALLGSSGEKLVETFRQSSRSFAQWFEDVKRYKDLTDDQKASLQRFSEAQGRLGVAFDRLGQQISAIVAKHLGPLLEKFAAFVEQNTPAILAAVDQLASRFAAWLNDPETGKAFVAGIQSVVDALKWVINNLDTIKLAVEVIAGLFAFKWAVGIVQAIGAVTSALGASASIAGAAVGTGLIGALAGVAAIAGLLALGSKYETPENRAALDKLAKERRDPAGGPNGPTVDYWIDAQGRKHDATTGALTDDAAPAVRPPGVIQKQSSSGGYLPGGVTPAAFHPGGPAAAGLAGGSEFWDSMARAVTKGFEDAVNHLRDVGSEGAGGAGGGGAAGGVQRASYSPAGGGGFGPAGGAPAQQGGAPSSPPGSGAGVGGGSAGGSGGIDAPAGTPIARTGLATVTSASGRKFQVDARFAPNFQGFIDDYEKAGGKIGPDSGTLGSRPHNASGHPIGAAIDINQIGRGVRSNRAPSLDPRLEDQLAKKWGMVSGNSWRSNDQGHFGIESVEAARRALIAQGRAPGAGYKTLTKDQLDIAPRAPAATVPGPASINGSVDVSITHKNPPANSAVTATGSGAVNVAPPRVEHQAMESI